MVLWPAATASAQGYFEYSATAVETYELIFSLRFQEAKESLVRLKITEPDNLIVHSLGNYMDCLSLFIGEQNKTFEKIKQHKQQRLAAIKKGDRQSPYFLYTQADIHLQWAITRVKFEEYFQAVMEIKRAFHLLERNEQLHPDFMPNKKNLGLLHALIGTVPDQYRWGLKILGMSGTIAEGRREIEEVIDHAKSHPFVFRDEVYVMYAYLLLHLENQGEEAWQMIQNAGIDATTNPLACFVHANIAMKTGRNDMAIQILENKPEGRDYFPFPYLSFMEGVARLNRLDPSARDYLLRFLKETRGLHYIKEAYQKLAWHARIHGERQGYLGYMSLCKSLGSAVVEEDKTALYEARSGRMPDQALLKARVLFDGGYYAEARHVLEERRTASLSEKIHQLEYTYRMARIYHAQGDYTAALRYYHQTIEHGRFEGVYFACNAALHSGLIFELLGQPQKARNYFDMTLTIKPDQYQSSLHQKAKAGLLRIEDLP